MQFSYEIVRMGMKKYWKLMMDLDGGLFTDLCGLGKSDQKEIH